MALPSDVDDSSDDDRIILESEEEKSQESSDRKVPRVTGRPKSIPPTATTAVSKVSSRIHRLLQAYITYISKSLHHDRGIKLLQWTLWLTSRILLVRDQPESSAAFRKLYNEFSMARYVSRILGLPAALEAAQSGSWSIQSSHTRYPKLHAALGQVMAWSMVGYYPTELLAYLRWTVPSKHQKPRTAEWWSYWSCRFWLLYILAETCQCGLVYKERFAELQAKASGDGKDDKLAKAENQQALRYTKLQLLRNALFVLPCVQWSLPNWDTQPWLPENVVHGLMWLESVVCLFQ